MKISFKIVAFCHLMIKTIGHVQIALIRLCKQRWQIKDLRNPNAVQIAVTVKGVKDHRLRVLQGLVLIVDARVAALAEPPKSGCDNMAGQEGIVPQLKKVVSV